MYRLSLNFSVSWAELVFNLYFHTPIRESFKMAKNSHMQGWIQDFLVGGRPLEKIGKILKKLDKILKKLEKIFKKLKKMDKILSGGVGPPP